MVENSFISKIFVWSRFKTAVLEKQPENILFPRNKIILQKLLCLLSEKLHFTL